uniref:Si:dkey-283b1.7 n=1 Tax=Electrophorus electricus TaxID=8005 RepID=A0A4W4EK84_ELEEL
MRSLALCMSLALRCVILQTASEYSSKSDLEYEFWDYRGKFCIDDQGFVYNIGDVYYPASTACPCTCTEDGPVCMRPKCPRIHPRCTRIRYKSCCPVCEAVSKVCVYGRKTYRLLEEFKLSPCERCRCEANRQVYCSISECPALHCVNPIYEPNRCCPVCKNGPNCFAGNRVIPVGERVEVDEWTVCYCTYRDGTWHTHPHIPLWEMCQQKC